jgi:predicted ATPase
MTPVKGSSVLHSFSFHHVPHHMMMTVHFHPVMWLVHASVHSLVHHRLVLSDRGRCDHDRGQRRQNV